MKVYMTEQIGLTFNILRVANQQRLPQFKNAKGYPTNHEDWTPSDWVCAVVGELGELANVVKKMHRGDVTLEDVRDDCADELADVVTYLDILAEKLGVDLGRATIDKFNRVSVRVESTVRIREDGSEVLIDN